MLAAEAVKFFAGTGATMVLARLLRPDDFGLAAMALATIAILGKVKDVGLFTATVQSQRIDQAQASALFWLSAAFAAAVSLLSLILAPAMGWFYRDARLVALTAALACVPFIDGVTLQLAAVMTRQMRFVALSVIDAAALAAGVTAALALAWSGAGYWALVAQEVVYSAAYTAAIWTMCRWRPGWPRRRSDIGPMVTFGLHLSGFRVLNHLALNLDTVFVGRFRGPLEAGIYDRAYRLLTVPSSLLNQPLSSVAVPALSRLQGDAGRYRVFYLAWIRFVFALTMPLVVFLFVDAERAVLTILGPQWMAIVPIYRVLAPAAFIGRLNVVTRWLYVTTGRTDRQLRWSAFLLVPMVVAYAIGVRWGAFGVAVAHTVVTCTLWYPGVVYLLPDGSGPPARGARRDDAAGGDLRRSRNSTAVGDAGAAARIQRARSAPRRFRGVCRDLRPRVDRVPRRPAEPGAVRRPRAGVHGDRTRAAAGGRDAGSGTLTLRRRGPGSPVGPLVG